MKIYTKTGDKGKTSLYGGERVEKTNLRISCLGGIDSLNSILGVAASLAKKPQTKDILVSLEQVQVDLFAIGAELATPETSPQFEKLKLINKKRISELEKEIDRYQETLPELHNFILPGGSKLGAMLHHARSTCREAEIAVLMLARKYSVREEVRIYLNRLSDYLFTLARSANLAEKTPEQTWHG